jgi:sugar phosphate isomerase/epimerase
MSDPRLGVSLQTVSTTLTDELYAALDGSGIATVEIAAAYFACACDEAQKAPLLEALRRNGIQAASIHALFGGAHDFSSPVDSIHQQAVATALCAVDLAVELGAPLVIVHASAEPLEPRERGARLEQARRGLLKIGDRCRRAGKRAAVEVLPRTCLGNTVDELLALLDGLDPTVFGVCLDTNHLMDRYETLPDEIRKLSGRLIATHLSDYDGIDEKHWLPGEGVVDWGAVMAALREIDYRGPLNYEAKLPGETPAERVAALRESFARLVAVGR